MNCPYCGRPMEEAYLSSKSPVLWSDEVTGHAIPTRHGDVPLGKMLGLLRPQADLCRDCEAVIVKY